MDILKEAGTALEKLRFRRPLIHHITNFVTMNDCANVTLAIGASPTMTDAVEEAANMAGASAALLLNLGTLQQSRLDAMLLAGSAAACRKIPIILDPVGAGGTIFRTNAALQLLQALPITIIRGNLSEVSALAARRSGVNVGVDNHAGEVVSVELVRRLASLLGTTIVITGVVDAVSDGTHTALLGNGCAMLARVTGTGCMTTSLIASYAAVAPSFVSAVAGVLSMGIAGVAALARCGGAGPGTFHTLLMDAVYNLAPETFTLKGKVLEYHE